MVSLSLSAEAGIATVSTYCLRLLAVVHALLNAVVTPSLGGLVRFKWTTGNTFGDTMIPCVCPDCQEVDDGDYHHDDNNYMNYTLTAAEFDGCEDCFRLFKDNPFGCHRCAVHRAEYLRQLGDKATMCLSDAKKAYKLYEKDVEDLPFAKKPNPHNRKCPMKLYLVKDLKRVKREKEQAKQRKLEERREKREVRREVRAVGESVGRNEDNDTSGVEQKESCTCGKVCKSRRGLEIHQRIDARAW